MSCSGLVGSETDVALGRPPEVACIAGYGGVSDASMIDFSDPTTLSDIGVVVTYNAARNSVLKTGDAFCDDVSESICGALIGCVADGEGTESDEVLMSECITAFNTFNNQCKETSLYDQRLPLDLNLTRWMADDCVTGLTEVDACDITAWPIECAGGFVSVDGGTNLMDIVLSSAMAFLGDR